MRHLVYKKIVNGNLIFKAFSLTLRKDDVLPHYINDWYIEKEFQTKNIAEKFASAYTEECK